MLRMTKIKVICNGELINTYSKGRGCSASIWSNPFDEIPMVDDYIRIANGDKEPQCYRVTSRLFNSSAEYVGKYDKSEVILNTIKVNIDCTAFNI